jgi:nanoRNase/pAp phosphatase (c-di-AMP/oligoRNAs hydrolase)
MAQTYVLYHADCLDGFTAAWTFWKFNNPNASFIPVRYGSPSPVISPGSDVYILDFSYNRKTLTDLSVRCLSLLVLDHHKTAQEDLKGLPFAVFDMNRSGAGLAWDYFALTSPLDEPRPWLVDYIEDRDLFRNRLPKTKEVSALTRSIPRTFQAWDRLSEMPLEQAQKLGEGCLAHLEGYIQATLPHAFLATLDSIVLPLVNVAYEGASDVANALLDYKWKTDVAGYYFERPDGQWQYGLRSNDYFDCSVLAKEFGGGGHKGAAGFVTSAPIHGRVPSE